MSCVFCVNDSWYLDINIEITLNISINFKAVLPPFYFFRVHLIVLLCLEQTARLCIDLRSIYPSFQSHLHMSAIKRRTLVPAFILSPQEELVQSCSFLPDAYLVFKIHISSAYSLKYL